MLTSPAPQSTTAAIPAAPHNRPDHTHRPLLWLLLIPVLLLAVWLAVPHLKGAFWVDEVITVERAGSPVHGGPFSPAQIWQLTAEETYDQVPGYFWLVAGWDHFLGWSEFSTRLLSLMFGLLGAAWTYRLGRDLYSPLTGLAAAVVLLLSAFFINFLHEARTYTLLVLLGAMMIWLYWRIITHRTGWLTQAAFVLTVAGILYAHYFATLLIFSVCLYHVLFVTKNRAWWRIVILMGLAGVLFLPWFLTSFDVVQGAGSEVWRQELSLTVPEIITDILNAFSNNSLTLLLIVAVLSLAAIRKPAVRYIWVLFAAPLGFAILINVWLGMLVAPKYLMFLWVPLALIVGVGVTRMVSRGLHPVLVLIPWLLVGVWSSLNWQEDPIKYIAWDVLHAQLAEQIQPDDAIVFHLSATLWDGAHNRGLDHYFYDFPVKPALLWSWPHATDAVYLQDLPQIVAGKQRVWSSYDPLQRPARMSLFDAAMQEYGFADCGRAAKDRAMWVDLYARPPEDMTYHFGGDQYADGINMTLLGPITHDQAGGPLIPLGWRLGDEVPLNTYSYGLHALTVDGALMGQVDAGLPPDHDFGCQVAAFPDLPPGEYQLELVVYAWETGERLNVTASGSDLINPRVALGTFQVQ